MMADGIGEPPGDPLGPLRALAGSPAGGDSATAVMEPRPGGVAGGDDPLAPLRQLAATPRASLSSRIVTGARNVAANAVGPSGISAGLNVPRQAAGLVHSLSEPGDDFSLAAESGGPGRLGGGPQLDLEVPKSVTAPVERVLNRVGDPVARVLERPAAAAAHVIAPSPEDLAQLSPTTRKVTTAGGVLAGHLAGAAVLGEGLRVPGRVASAVAPDLGAAASEGLADLATDPAFRAQAGPMAEAAHEGRVRPPGPLNPVPPQPPPLTAAPPPARPSGPAQTLDPMSAEAAANRRITQRALDEASAPPAAAPTEPTPAPFKMIERRASASMPSGLLDAEGKPIGGDPLAPLRELASRPPATAATAAVKPPRGAKRVSPLAEPVQAGPQLPIEVVGGGGGGPRPSPLAQLEMLARTAPDAGKQAPALAARAPGAERSVSPIPAEAGNAAGVRPTAGDNGYRGAAASGLGSAGVRGGAVRDPGVAGVSGALEPRVVDRGAAGGSGSASSVVGEAERPHLVGSEAPTRAPQTDAEWLAATEGETAQAPKAAPRAVRAPPISTHGIAGREKISARDKDYLKLGNEQLLDELHGEHQNLDRLNTETPPPVWVRENDYGEPVSGGRLDYAINRQQAGYAAQRITAIERELTRRGLTADEVQSAIETRRNQALERPDETGLEDADTSFYGEPETTPRSAAARAKATGPASEATRSLVNPQALNLSTEQAAQLDKVAADVQRRGFGKSYKSFAEQHEDAKQFARELGQDPSQVDLAKLKNLSGAHIVALRQLLKSHLDTMTELERNLADPTMTMDLAEHVAAQLDQVRQSAGDYLQTVVRESSERGRDLGMLRAEAAASLDSDVWAIRAQRAAGRPLTGDELAEIDGLADAARVACGVAA